MSPVLPLLLAIGLGLAGWLVARARAWTFKRSAPDGRIAALPTYHAWYAALWIVVPVILWFLIWNGISGNLVLSHVLASPEAQGLPERDIPDYVAPDGNDKVQFTRVPKLDEVPYPVTMEPNLVVEFYSR